MKRPDAVDWDKLEQFTLALMHLTTFADKGAYRTWKGYDWDVLDRLHEKGWISSPATTAKSVIMSDEGRKRSQELFERHFVKAAPKGAR